MIFIEIAGHLGADPETRFTPAGKKVTNLRVATNIWRGGKEKTVWWKVELWDDRFDRKLQYLKKGSAVLVRGEMKIPDVEIYQDREGNAQVAREIIAEHVGFSPFGKQDRQDGTPSVTATTGGENEHEALAGARSYAPSQGVGVHSTMQTGQSHSSGFEEDDIPF